MTAITERAPAKINLALHVVGQRADEYHLIESLVVFTKAGDHLHVTQEAEDAFAVDGAYACDIPAGADNLVIKARDRFRIGFPEHAGRKLAIRLEKALPVASGVGGGSADAAATLRAMARLCGVQSTEERLFRIAAALGADVPMCLAGVASMARGIGEELQPLPEFPPLHLVLANPGVGVATVAVFKRLMRKTNPPIAADPDTRSFGQLVEWLGKTRNDLMAPAIEVAPQIGDTIDALSSAGARFARMSGSGATCFGMFETASAAQAAAGRLAAARPAWFVTATQTMTERTPVSA